MTVTTHDVTIEGINEEDWLKVDEVEIDLDNDNLIDINFRSERDSVDSGTGFEFWNVILEVPNPFVEILEIKNSGDEYYLETPYYQNWEGSFPRRERRLITGCQDEDYTFIGAGANNPMTFMEGEEFNPNELVWGENSLGYLELASSGHEFMECEFNETFDSLTCDITILEPTCYPIPTGEKTYLLFRKYEDENCFSIGWIEVLLTDQNKLEIKRSAISNKQLEF